MQTTLILIGALLGLIALLPLTNMVNTWGAQWAPEGAPRPAPRPAPRLASKRGLMRFAKAPRPAPAPRGGLGGLMSFGAPPNSQRPAAGNPSTFDRLGALRLKLIEEVLLSKDCGQTDREAIASILTSAKACNKTFRLVGRASLHELAMCLMWLIGNTPTSRRKLIKKQGRRSTTTIANAVWKEWRACKKSHKDIRNCLARAYCYEYFLLLLGNVPHTMSLGILPFDMLEAYNEEEDDCYRYAQKRMHFSMSAKKAWQVRRHTLKPLSDTPWITGTIVGLLALGALLDPSAGEIVLAGGAFLGAPRPAPRPSLFTRASNRIAMIAGIVIIVGSLFLLPLVTYVLLTGTPLFQVFGSLFGSLDNVGGASLASLTFGLMVHGYPANYCLTGAPRATIRNLACAMQSILSHVQDEIDNGLHWISQGCEGLHWLEGLALDYGIAEKDIAKQWSNLTYEAQASLVSEAFALGKDIRGTAKEAIRLAIEHLAIAPRTSPLRVPKLHS